MFRVDIAGGRRSFDKLAGLVGAKLVSGCAVSVQMTDESASSGGNDEGLCLMRDGDTYEVPVGLEEYDCAGLTCIHHSDVHIL